jgi:Fe-Mn family superoxide dismutase
MEIHHNKHHQGYIDKLNEALKAHPELQKKSLEQLLSTIEALPESVRTAIRNQGGGTWNHTFFWPIMKPNGGGLPKGKIAEQIKKIFGGFEPMQEQFNTAAKGVFGSGWAWLVVDKQGALKIISTPNQDTPISAGVLPVIGLDVWEHAYYLKYQNKRPDYINAWWHVVNWDQAEENYLKIMG